MQLATPARRAQIADFAAATLVVIPDADPGYGFYSDQPAVTALVDGTVPTSSRRNLK